MMRRWSVLCVSFCSAALLLSACSLGQPRQPQINFIGIGTGTLTTDVNSIKFRSTFSPKERQLVGVVSFSQIDSGTTVMATWFSPDDRTIPLGRTQINTQKDAHIARFSFASRQDWRAAPYMLRIDAIAGSGKYQRAASGSVSFFIGMRDADIKAYIQDYTDWQKAQAKENAKLSAQQQLEQTFTTKVSTLLQVPAASVALRTDFTGGGKTDYFITGSASQDNTPEGGGGPGVLYSGTPLGFAVVDGSGNLLLIGGEQSNGKRIVRDASQTIVDNLPAKGDLQVVVLPSASIAITWSDATQKSCTVEIHAGSNSHFVAGATSCRAGQ
jgi:hypothetical protein